MTSFCKSLAKRFAGARDGVAATEFALIAPVMVLIFLGIVEGSDALSANRRVSLAVNTLADLVAQEAEITQSQLKDLYIGVEDIIDQRDIDVDFRVVSLILDPDTDKVVVHWSKDSDGKEPYRPGTEYQNAQNVALFDPSSSLIVGEIEYNYSSRLSKSLIASVPFKKSATRWPRRSNRVQFCTRAGACTR